MVALGNAGEPAVRHKRRKRLKRLGGRTSVVNVVLVVRLVVQQIMGKYLDLIDAASDVLAETSDRAEAERAFSHSDTIIEATLRPAIPWRDLLAAAKPLNPQFPACPECHHARYWISPRGKVVCGKCGGVRFVLVAIQYHPVS
jgi:hypothetical protein